VKKMEIEHNTTQTEKEREMGRAFDGTIYKLLQEREK